MSIEEIQELKEQVRKTNDNVEQIHTALLGDLENPDKGALKRIKVLEDFMGTCQKLNEKIDAYMVADKALKDNWRGRFAVIAFIGVPLITVVTSILIKFFTT